MPYHVMAECTMEDRDICSQEMFQDIEASVAQWSTC